jgi:Icc-related predicted phosphoesterase
MKIAVCSDLHLEFSDLDLTNDENADVLILGGDIFVADDCQNFRDIDEQILAATPSMLERGQRYYHFLKRCSERFPQVVFIMGNHEHYHGDFGKTANIIRTLVGEFSNVHFLDKEWCIINGILFFGGTLWTDMNNEDPQTLRQMTYTMNDYRGVLNSNKNVSFKTTDLTSETPDKYVFKERVASFKPEDSVEDHYDFRRKLDETLELHPNLPVVVCGHHSPSKASTHPKYKHEVIMNGAYSTNLDNFILDRRQIKLWTHGHTHEDFDYMIGTTRIVCNPRGYHGYEDRADNFKLKYVEI